ncbi:hypothetical protein FQR65_LT15454 [Abscondita terminalis]|nr:hypothetical protein FQR65_LT15454 [Abscondita terminalis]
MSKSARLRFNVSDDIMLLQHVIALNPFENERRWDEVLQSVINESGKQFTLRSIKEHLDHILKLFVKEDLANIRKSGTEEEYTEKERLLQEVVDLQKEYKPMKATKNMLCRQKGGSLLSNTSKESAPASPGYSHVSTPTNTRKRTSSGLLKNITLKLLQDKQAMDHQFKERELAILEKKTILDEKRFKLEEEKWQLEKKEREARLAIEVKEKTQQQAIIDLLIKNFSVN